MDTCLPACLTLSFGKSQVLLTCPTGASHVEKGQPCQDACGASQHFFQGQPYLVLAIADGHGGEKYNQSEIGAHLAVEAARDAATDLVVTLVSAQSNHPTDWARLVKHEANRLGRNLVQHWRRRIEGHAGIKSEEGVSDQDLECIGRYGTTVAMVVMYESTLIAGSIGDSSIFTVEHSEPSGEVRVNDVTPQRDRGVGLATESLVSPNAHHSWQAKAMVIDELIDETELAMVLLTTDGMTDSLEDPKQSIRNLYERAVNDGLDWLKNVLPKQLSRWSDKGVGDDMGCVVMFPIWPVRVRGQSNEDISQEAEGGEQS
ncbi:protein phosphatase 2C domain-containing protein [Thioalkalivibrio sp. ALE11]|uniref:protein phosphatase 2C domain-containing protein n=1 Tax=Thioalkalivibrio sp. ALE11 TaxID=1265494 RepID=UPI0009DA4DDF|nr:protein phosphatase 2C domain-containing protein [Thioalkalivibrio sp. ALE11]